MSVHVTRLFNDGNAFIPHEDPPERLAVPCRWCVVGWILPAGANGCDEWIKCPACMGTLRRSETNEEMATRLAGDLDEYERLQRTET